MEHLSIGSHGKAAYLLKESSKKKRSREEIEEVKAEEELLKNDKQGSSKSSKSLRRTNRLPMQGLLREAINQATGQSEYEGAR